MLGSGDYIAGKKTIVLPIGKGFKSYEIKYKNPLPLGSVRSISYTLDREYISVNVSKNITTSNEGFSIQLENILDPPQELEVTIYWVSMAVPQISGDNNFSSGIANINAIGIVIPIPPPFNTNNSIIILEYDASITLDILFFDDNPQRIIARFSGPVDPPKPEVKWAIYKDNNA
jgi:hypothetical protein